MLCFDAIRPTSPLTAPPAPGLPLGQRGWLPDENQMLTPENRFREAPAAYHAPAQLARVVEVLPNAPRTVAALTVYRSGLVNLNGEAVANLAPARAVTLAAPSSPGARWLLFPVEADQPGALALFNDRGMQKFRAFALATALFAALPDSQKKLLLELCPGPAGVFQLVVR